MNIKVISFTTVIAMFFVLLIAIMSVDSGEPSIQESSSTTVSQTRVETLTENLPQVITTQLSTTIPETTTQKSTTTKKVTTTKKTTTTKKATVKVTAPANNYEHNLYVLSHIIYAEAGGEGDKTQKYVGSVVLNRVADSRFPNTIEGVVFQKGQYSPVRNGAYYKTPSERAVKNAKYLLDNGSILPSGVIFQSEFKQGSVYEKVGNMYFCYG